MQINEHRSATIVRVRCFRVDHHRCCCFQWFDSRLTFECLIQGSEPINVIWLKDRTVISSLTYDIRYEHGLATLTFVDVQQHDSGHYTCRASNTAGTVETSAYLIVKGSSIDIEQILVDETIQ
jgi:Immunoglobulin I-set domain